MYVYLDCQDARNRCVMLRYFLTINFIFVKNMQNNGYRIYHRELLCHVNIHCHNLICP